MLNTTTSAFYTRNFIHGKMEFMEENELTIKGERKVHSV